MGWSRIHFLYQARSQMNPFDAKLGDVVEVKNMFPEGCAGPVNAYVVGIVAQGLEWVWGVDWVGALMYTMPDSSSWIAVIARVTSFVYIESDNPY